MSTTLFNPCLTASRWDSVAPSVPLSPQQGYITLPIFEIDNLLWAGASYVSIQFDYTVASNISLIPVPVKPGGLNFILCVKWRVGTTVYRYKLWDHNDGLLYVPLYTGQRVGKNFVLEVWTISSSETVSLSSPVNFYTSLLHAQACHNRLACCPSSPSLIEGDTDSLCSGDNLFTPFPLPLPLPINSCVYWLDNIV